MVEYLKTLYFDNITTLCQVLSEKYDTLTDEFDEISIISKYNEAKEIVKELLNMGHDVASLDLHREEFENYYDEYIISLNSDGVWCEKFKRDNGYFNDTSIITYISNECNSTCIPYVKSNDIYAFEISKEECELEESDSAIHYSTDEDGETHGFSASKSNGNSYVGYSFYSTEKLDRGMVNDLLRSFGF